jgi:hypothetical protein
MIYPDDAAEFPSQQAYFDELGAQPGIRLRLGHLVERKPGTSKAKWEQKCVDTLLVLDLVRLAQARAFDIALIIAGDRDLAEDLRWSGRFLLGTASRPASRSQRGACC